MVFVILHTSKLREIKLPWWIRCIMLLDSLAAKQYFNPSDNAGLICLYFLTRNRSFAQIPQCTYPIHVSRNASFCNSVAAKPFCEPINNAGVHFACIFVVLIPYWQELILLFCCCCDSLLDSHVIVFLPWQGNDRFYPHLSRIIHRHYGQHPITPVPLK